MSKYFTDDTSTLTNQLEEQTEEVNYAMPTPMAVDKSIRDKIIQQDTPTPIQAPTSVEEHIAVVNHQNKTVNKMMEEITAGTAEKITNTFESLSTLELFERMNQISFLLVKMNSRLDSIEKAINNGNISVNTTQTYTQVDTKETADVDKVDYQEQAKIKDDISKLSPREQYAMEQTKTLSPLETAQKQLADGIKTGGAMPDEGYVDSSTNLEKIFPNMPDDAYQAAYESINDIRKK